SESLQFSKLKLGFELDHSRAGIFTTRASQHTGRRLLQIANESEGCIPNVSHGETEIRMVERVEELKPYGEGGTFPMQERALGDGKVSCEVTGGAELVAPLGEIDDRTVARSGRCWQPARIEAGFASGLQEPRARTGGCPIRQHL